MGSHSEELCDHIYYFTEDHVDEDPWKDSKDLGPDYNAGSWESDSNFKPYTSLLRHMNNIDSQALRRPLAFAQTCKQLRAEYRPFWLSHARLCVDVNVLQAFTDTILLISDDYKYAPKELYVSYSYDVYNQPDAPIDDAKNRCFGIRCSFDEDTGDTKMHIRLNEGIRKSCDLAQYAEKLLKRWGASSVKYAEHMRFLFEFDVRQDYSKEHGDSARPSTCEVTEIASKSGGSSNNEWFRWAQFYL
ncbi:hypothetical protein SLS59_001541 [Nothophoma quercina]|uniref:Uncharacterized protein n=1 Tax=Nothophoma quercina TaxID=749835 RepID=A0ABR3RYW2_9PLEO